jgi:acetyl esterase/lipase
MSQGEIEAVRRLLGAKPRPVGWPARRQRIEEVGAHWPVAADIKVRAVDLDGVPGEWSIAPGSDEACILVFFHGGGYCSGSLVSHRRMVTEAGRAAGLRTLAVDYRLAPEHRFPAALEDALAAWRWLRRQGVAARHIAVGGDSAGGGLSVSLINALHAAGEEGPACAWLVSPWTDLTMSGATMTAKDAVDPLIHKGYLAELADAYVPPGMDRRDPRLSPLFADLRRLPPILVQVGSDETLLADATRFADAAGTANVAVTLEIWPHMIHAWPLWNAGLTAGRDALANAGSFMRRHLGQPPGARAAWSPASAGPPA